MASPASAPANKTFVIDIGTHTAEEFDEHGYILPWKIAFTHQCIRAIGLRLTMKEQHPLFFNNHTLFVRHLKVDVDDKLNSKSILSVQPTHGLFSVLYCGKSSMLFESKIMVSDDCFSKCHVQMVCVNRATRKSTPFPDTIKNIYFYASANKPDIPPMLQFNNNSSGVKSYCKKFIICEEDVDLNKHTNNTAYLKFCVHLAREAVAAKTFTVITLDVVRSKLKEFIIQYLGETLEGDEVVFTVWQSSQNEHLLHFEAKCGGNVVCRCQLHFNSKLCSSL
ncbi:uncharacterized protein [Antedon mediterranea]|uniref:uncharacterized protein n=1 Tax=Antedon mediterranea TaxID=105859 RepID=UPI003AF7B52F